MILLDSNCIPMDPEPANGDAELFARAILRLIKADNDLMKAKKAVPEYTGQSSVESYYTYEQDAWNRAADHIYSLR